VTATITPATRNVAGDERTLSPAEYETWAAEVRALAAERGAVVKAFVVLTPEFALRDRGEITENLQEHVRERLAPYEYPKEIEFVEELPMTTTGKIQRRILRQREEERARASRPQ